MISVNNLAYTYPGAKSTAINNISFSVDKGEIFGFLGPSGAGKSTTQKVLIRLIRNYSGQIIIRGKRLDQWNSDFYNYIGVGFELPNHYSRLTGLENLKYFSSFYARPAQNLMDLLKIVGLAEDANKPTQEYSKGMKMRLNFIRALLHDPDILFLDEPTSGLDPVNARLIKDIILDLKSKGKTIFLTTHNMHDAEELCDRVSFIVDGELRVTDTPRNLKLNNGRRTVLVEYGHSNFEKSSFSLENLGENTDFINLLQNEYIQSIHSQEAGLDEVFINTTGKSLT